MRYVIVSVTKGSAGDFNNSLRKDVFKKFQVKSSKLPAHFTIKSPFECDDISTLESNLKYFCENNKSAPYKVIGYNNFDNRVIYMEVFMSNSGKITHDKLIDELSKLSYINFSDHDGKDKVFHITVASKKIQKNFIEIYNYVKDIDCHFECVFDNISIFKWENNTWELHKEYLLK
ncbi:2'-5' RNA ligase family protein [Paraclostridium sordellii]